MSQEKIKPVGEEQSDGNPSFSADEVGGVKQDMGKVALVISVLAVFLLVIFYYTVNSKVNEVSEQVGLIEETRSMVQDMDDRMDKSLGDVTQKVEQATQKVEQATQEVAAMDARIAELENLPGVVRNMVLGGMLEEMSQKADYVGTQVSTEQQEKLKQAQELMRQVQQSIQEE